MKVNRLALWIMKQMLISSDKKSKKKWPPIDYSRAKRDIVPYEGAKYDQCYDIYYAKEPNGITLIDIHGGAYVFSHRTNNALFAQVFNEMGFNVALVDYRLNHGQVSPHEQLQDISREIAHLNEHAEEFGLDRTKFALMGDSAGGHFALMIAAMMDDPEIAERIDCDLNGCKACCVAVNSPVFDLIAIGKGDAMTKGAKKYMFGKRALDLDYIALVSPRENLDSLKMPIFLSTCKNDFIRNESMMLEEALKQRGCPHEFMDIEADDVAHVHNVVDVVNESSVRVNKAMAEFFLSHLAK